MSAIRSSREEFDFLQQRKGAESSNEVSERSRPATDNLALIKGRHGFPNEVQLCLPFAYERADTVSEGKELRKPPPKALLLKQSSNDCLPSLIKSGTESTFPTVYFEGNGADLPFYCQGGRDQKSVEKTLRQSAVHRATF
ncbi:hypothetical protein TIFTF001_049152 [Ficus carica]|uniref:Uncharacterized protein n=1 Tax=Ficus carica TaxID=3494 RepID=A0AA87YWD8_FICCA|nr:hypothetical protein TIFTF001_049143 [Ficus carica]GMN24516.1 hypothetical protein TIFTF001_049146 [Ficus carica]GMN24548.1 hypothetical protein TIFTF001_049149 [Ficus carica]GMN24558.1 hypothetical protein TIFTF001_049152 [Ficus carica]